MCVMVCAALLSCASGNEIYHLDDEETVDVDRRALRNFYPKEPNLTSQKELVSSAPEKYTGVSLVVFAVFELN